MIIQNPHTSVFKPILPGGEIITSINLANLKQIFPLPEEKNIPQTCRSESNLPPLSAGGNRVKLNNEQTTEKFLYQLKSFLEVENGSIERKALILHSITKNLPDVAEKLNPSEISLLNKVLYMTFSRQPPFTAPSISFKSIFLPQRAHTVDVTIAYGILTKVYTLIPHYRVPNNIIRALIVRLSSASSQDRKSAKMALSSFDQTYTNFILHKLSIAILPPPLHGVRIMLELMADLIKKCKNNDEYSPLEELFQSLKLLHSAPHLQTFAETLTETLLVLFEHIPDYANEMRLYLLNHWTRNDPQRSVLFMKEATIICSRGPPLDEYVWQRFTWRASSIYIPLALEGLNFITQTSGLSRQFNNSVLRYLLLDAMKGHWSDTVRARAKIVYNNLQASSPAPPKKMPIATWTLIKEQAKINYPEMTFKPAPRRYNPK